MTRTDDILRQIDRLTETAPLLNAVYPWMGKDRADAVAFAELFAAVEDETGTHMKFEPKLYLMGREELASHARRQQQRNHGKTQYHKLVDRYGERRAKDIIGGGR